MDQPTLFLLILQERRWDSWVVFCPYFEKAARELSQELNSRRLADVTVARRTFDLWVSEDWHGNPGPDAAQILERLLGVAGVDLFSSAQGMAVGHDGALERARLQTAVRSEQGFDETSPHGSLQPARASLFNDPLLAFDK